MSQENFVLQPPPTSITVAAAAQIPGIKQDNYVLRQDAKNNPPRVVSSLPVLKSVGVNGGGEQSAEPSNSNSSGERIWEVGEYFSR